MDSVSQAALGAAVGVAVLGRRLPVWQAAASGALLGTLPDLDVLIDRGDAVRNMVLHRGETHAVFWQLLATPVLGWLISRLPGQRAWLGQWCVAIALILVTHALLDAVTVYGTQLALPFSNHPFGAGSLFIIDPLYTLPLLIGLLLALLFGRRRDRALRCARIALGLSTAYIGWSLLAQQLVADAVRQHPPTASAERLLVTPTPFNTLLWRVVAMYPDAYVEGYVPLEDAVRGDLSRAPFMRFARDPELERHTAHIDAAQQIRRFSKGFHATRETPQGIIISDLRMGQTPYFVFSFRIAERLDDGAAMATVPQQLTTRMPLDAGLPWLLAGLSGQLGPPPGWPEPDIRPVILEPDPLSRQDASHASALPQAPG